VGSSWGPGLTSDGTRLIDSSERRGEIEVLFERALHNTRQDRVIEAGPPGFNRRRRRFSLATIDRGAVVEVCQLGGGGPLYWGPTTHPERLTAMPRPAASANARPVVRG